MRISLCLIFLAFVIVACGPKSEKKGSSDIDAKKLFKINCMLCHGIDGKLGANGSKDLSKSELTLADRVEIITNGKGMMVPYKGMLSTEEIKAVAELTLKME